MKMMNMTGRRPEELRPASWATSHLLRPDERLLADSLTLHGWLMPLVVTRDGLIVDGNQRYRLATSDPKVAAALPDTIPVNVVDVDEVDAMLVHMRLNRGRGMVVAKRTSSLLREVLAAGRYERQAVRKMLCMTPEEFEVLCDAVYIKLKAVSQHQYSRAWVPIEAAKPGQATSSMEYEYPVNPDN
jgi:ParB-like chromosome segregation protein Spo0J